MSLDSTRRKLLFDSIALGFAGAASLPLLAEPFPQQSRAKEKEAAKGPEVTATEDLMREHGVLRRALLVFLEVVPKLRQNAAGVDAAALQQTAKLFRTFGEDYHERMLEEQHIFPLIRKQGPELKRYSDILVEQHNRGREVTDYVLAVTNGPRISVAHVEPLAKVLETFVLMYQNHAARERIPSCFPRGRRISPISSLMKYPTSLKTSNTKCLAKMDLKMQRNRSAK
jgi:hemerythrin-like domain-containing protein